MNTELSQIDFIIPAWNAEKTILLTLQSLIDQSDPRWSAIVIDDGSTDRTVSAVESCTDPRVQRLVQPNAGPSAARNHGFREGNSRLVCFLDADDTLHPDFVLRMEPIATSSAIGAACGYEYRNQEGQRIAVVPAITDTQLNRDSILALDPPAIMSMVYKRCVLEEASEIESLFDETMKAYEDLDMLDRLVHSTGQRSGFIGRCEETLASYVCSPGSLSTRFGETWKQGCRFIQTRCETHDGASERIRQWGVGLLAGCIIVDDSKTANRVLQRIGPLASSDVPTLVQALLWQSMRQFALPMGDIGAVQNQILLRCSQVLCDPELYVEIESCLSNSGCIRDRALLNEAASNLRGDGRVVIYGLGRNGLQLMLEAERLGMHVWLTDDRADRCDDDPRRVHPSSISGDDVVIITPIEGSEMANQLTQIEESRVLMRHQTVAVSSS
jgi:hypothetical protein